MPRYAVGHRFPIQRVHLEPERVLQYLAAVGSASPLYQGESATAPPLAVAAWVLAGLIEAIGLPPGTLHATQEFTFMETVTLDSILDAETEVVQATSRGGMDVIVVEIRAQHEQRSVLTGRSMLMMPGSEG